jgi:dCMP deaminase
VLCYPRGVRRDIQLDDRDTKYKWVVHAEANAIYNATRQGKALDGATLYVTWPPCHECAKMIAQVGIQKVVFIADKDTQRWQSSFEQTVEVFNETEVKFVAYQQPTEPLILQRFISSNVVV